MEFDDGFDDFFGDLSDSPKKSTPKKEKEESFSFEDDSEGLPDIFDNEDDDFEEPEINETPEEPIIDESIDEEDEDDFDLDALLKELDDEDEQSENNNDEEDYWDDNEDYWDNDNNEEPIKTIDDDEEEETDWSFSFADDDDADEEITQIDLSKDDEDNIDFDDDEEEEDEEWNEYISKLIETAEIENNESIHIDLSKNADNDDDEFLSNFDDEDEDYETLSLDDDEEEDDIDIDALLNELSLEDEEHEIEELSLDDDDDEEDDSINSDDNEKDDDEDYFAGWDSIDDDEDNNEEKDDKPKKPVKKKENKDKKKSSFKDKFDSFKEQALTELSGKDPSKVKPKKNDDEDIDDDDFEDDIEDEDEDNEDKPKKKGKKKKSSHGLFNNKIVQLLIKIVKPFKNLYLKLVNLIFSIINGILGFFGKLPIIGKPFTWLQQFSNIIKYIATSLPLFLAFAFIIYSNIHAVPKTADGSMPDNGKATISNMSYDKDTHTAKGAITNTGDIIADVIPTFEIYSSNATNPFSWAWPSKKIECVGNPVQVETTKEVTVKCNGDVSGIFIKTGAKLDSDE